MWRFGCLRRPQQSPAHVQPGTYAPGEVPEYAFCEPVVAGVNARWYIRKVNNTLYLSGGIDTPSLCGRVKPFGHERGAIGGWDVNVKITERHLGHSCPACVEAYRLISIPAEKD